MNNKVGRLLKIHLLAVIFGILVVSVPFVSMAKEPETGLHVNAYLGNINDGATWPEEYEAEVFRFLSMVNPDWSDEQKIMFLHDYLVTRSDYDFEGLNDSMIRECQYGVLLGRGGICADYSEVFMELAGRMGFNVKTIHSNSMNHEWDLVEIGGEWFFIDCTWDDSAYKTEEPHFKMFCDHQFFLESEEAFRHGATDWYSLDSEKTRANAYNVYHNTTYDQACWYNSVSPVIITDEGFLVLKTNGKIYSCDTKGKNEKLIAAVPNSSRYGTLISVANHVFVSNSDTIYSVNTVSGELTVFYTLTQSEKDNYGSIYGIEQEGTKLRYDLASDAGKNGFAKSGYINLEQIIGNEICGINETALTFYEAGTNYNLKLLNYSGTVVSADSWTSSDPSVATVNSSGLVTGVGFGKTIITARKNGKKYSCTVAFDTQWQNDYIYGVWEGTYHLSEYIYLDQHLETGMMEDLVIPSYAYVGGDYYITSVRSAVFTGGINGRMRTGTKLFPDNSVIKTITLEKGTCLESGVYGRLQSCENLTAFDFGGADLSACNSIDGFFMNCKKLEFVNLSGCRMENSISTSNLLKYAPNIKRILTPAFVREGFSIPLPTALRVKNADGTYGTERITDLADAPRDSELVPLEDTTWQNDYEYRIAGVNYRSGNYLCLDKYIGTNENIYIPAKAIVNGTEYPVCVRGAEPTDGGFQCLSLFRNKLTIKSFSVEEGVIFDSFYTMYLFHSCTELKEVDLEGVDFSQTRYLYFPFTYCSSLEKVSFKGCNLGALTSIKYFFDGCTNLKELITPDAIADGISIPLPVTMYEVNEDGTTKETEYTKLEDAPRGCTLSSVKKEKPVEHTHQLTHTAAKNATCTEQGNTEYWYCAGCDHYYADGNASTEIQKDSYITSALGHNWNGGVVTKEPTEEEEGIKTFTCERCGNSYTETIPKKEHEHNLMHTEAKDAGCTETGNTEYWFCDKCGKYYADSDATTEIQKDSYITAALGHLWNEGEVTKEPTEEEEGIKTFTCGRCGETYTKSIPPKEHEHSLIHNEANDPTCTQTGNTEYWYCEGCDSYFADEEANTEIIKDSYLIAALGHKWNDGEVTKEPTEEEEGEKTFTCLNCGDTYTESIPKKEKPIPQNPVTEVFDDVQPTGWYVSAIQYVYDRGIMAGKGNIFGVREPLKRGQFVQTLYNLSGKPAVPDDAVNPFSDVPAKKGYPRDAVLWAVQNEIASGYGNGSFGVNNNIQRQQVAVMLYNYARKQGGYDTDFDANAIDGFSDSSKVAGWARESMSWAVTQGIISGKQNADGTYRLEPAGGATRAECASMIKKLLEKNNK